MKNFFLFLCVLVTLLAISHGYVQVISTTCQRLDSYGDEQWLTCPYEASRAALSVDELRDNQLSREEDQKYCCGDKKHRYCCSLEGKLRELPNFDPSNTNDDDPHTVYHYQSWYQYGWFTYLLIFSMTVIVFGLIFYIFGCVIANVLECIYWVLCSCCGKKKKDPVVTGKKTGKPYRPGDLGQGERSTLVVVSPPASSTPRTYSNPSPPNYQTIATPINGNNFGGAPDLYQNVTSTFERSVVLPTYEEAQQLQQQQRQQPTAPEQQQQLYPHV